MLRALHRLKLGKSETVMETLYITVASSQHIQHVVNCILKISFHVLSLDDKRVLVVQDRRLVLMLNPSYVLVQAFQSGVDLPV